MWTRTGGKASSDGHCPPGAQIEADQASTSRNFIQREHSEIQSGERNLGCFDGFHAELLVSRGCCWLWALLTVECVTQSGGRGDADIIRLSSI